MAVDIRSDALFVIWTSGKQSETERKKQSSRQHQHAAIVNHQRKKAIRSPIDSTNSYANEKAKVRAPSQSSMRHARCSSPVDGEEKAHSRQGELCLNVSPGAGRFDPFDSLCIPTLSGRAQTMLQFAIINQWPQYALSGQRHDVEIWRSALMKLGLETPVLLQGLIYSASSYHSFFGSKDRSLEVLRITSYHEITKYIRKTISMAESYSETLLLAIAILAMFGPPDFAQGKRIHAHRHIIAQDNEFYSRENPDRVHFQALIKLTKYRGGLASISHTNLAGLIYMLDVLDAFSTLRRPSFPMFMSPDAYMDEISYGQDLKKSQSREANETEDGFAFLRKYKPARKFLTVLASARALSDSYDAYIRDLNCGVDFVKFVIARRIIQHQALSTNSDGTLIYRLCRLGLLMFLCESPEPLPGVNSYHDFSSRQMMLMIDECDRLGYWEMHPDLLLWVTILGGYTARASPLRFWFAEQLRSSRLPMVKERWPDVQLISGRFLALKHRQGKGCQEFWESACIRLSGRYGLNQSSADAKTSG